MVILDLFLIGIATGTISALLGLGGGILLVPALTLLFHLPIRMAIGASLVGIIATSMGVAVTEKKSRKGNFRLALRLEVATTAGALIGSYVAGMINEKVLAVAFAIVALFTAVYMVLKGRHNSPDGPDSQSSPDESESLFRQDYRPKHWLAGLSLAGVAGALSGLLGVSGGFIKVPVMYSIMEVPLGIATTTSSIMVGITAAASVFIYYARGDIHPLVAIPIALGVFSGALLGGSLLPHARTAWLRAGMIGLLVLLSTQMLWMAIKA